MPGIRSRKRWLGLRLPQGAETLVSVFLLLFDALLLNQVFTLTFTLWLRSDPQIQLYLDSYLHVRWIMLALYVCFGMLSGIFNIRKLTAASDIFSHTSSALIASFIGFNLLAFFSRAVAYYAYTVPRPIFLLATGLSIFAVFALRVLLTMFLKPHPRLLRAIIIGDQSEGRRIIKHFHRRGGVRFRIVHTMTSDQLPDLASEVVFRHAHEVFVTDPNLNLDSFWAQIYYSRKEEPHDFKVRISIDPRKAAGTVGLQSLEDVPLITITSRPLTSLERFVKRVFDILFSVFALLISMPVMITTAILVRIDSPGPIFYKQKRVGRFGKEFDVLKFRSMRVGSEAKSGPTVSNADDPRVSPLGKFLRIFGIDELPQFFLVLTGEMSVVGPRPERPFFVKDYYEFQGRRLAVKPGVTGLAAVNARYYLRLVDKVTYDYYYLDNYSFVLDIKIIFQTVWVLLFKSNKALQDQHHELDRMKPPPEEGQSGESNGN